MSVSASLLVYDIPVGALDRDGNRLHNPSPELRRIGFRCTESVWVIPNNLVPYPLLNDLRLAGVEWELVKFDISEAPHLVEMARKSLRAEIKSAVKRARESAERRATKAGENENPEPERVEAAYLRSVRSVVKSATKLVKELEATGQAFGIEPQELDSWQAYTGLQAISSVAKLKAKTFADAVAYARKCGFEGVAMADGTEEKGCILILADWLEEREVDVTALRAAFSDCMGA